MFFNDLERQLDRRSSLRIRGDKFLEGRKAFMQIVAFIYRHAFNLDSFERRKVRTHVAFFIQGDTETIYPGMRPQLALLLARPETNFALQMISS